jgi:hypothetical protein
MQVLVSFGLAETKHPSFRSRLAGEESLRVPLIQNNEGFLASLGMTNQKGLIAKRRGPNDTTAQMQTG